jgi:tyrosyl-tRNA synthetase
MTFKSSILSDLEQRKLIADSTDRASLDELLASKSVTFYCGFDPTAPALHLGNLAQIITMMRFQKHGHRPLVLIGGATGLIGDPKESGERSLNTQDVVDGWLVRIKDSVMRYFDFTSSNACVVVNNYDWTKEVSAIAFLRDIGKHFSINRMLDRDAVSVRLANQGISYTEFSYVLLQSFDYVELNKSHDCQLQIGGSDQWGNITSGCDLVRRMNGVTVHALTTPLIVKADGTKFGKTESGTVWIDKELTSPYAFYQFWLNADDRDVETYLNTFSFKSHDEIRELVQQSLAEPHLRIGQRALAEELTTLVHSEDATRKVKEASEALFGNSELEDVDVATLLNALQEAGMVEVQAKEFDECKTVVDALVLAGISPSKGAARRTIAEGGAYLNNQRVSDPEMAISRSNLVQKQVVVLRRGKKTIAGIRLV